MTWRPAGPRTVLHLMFPSNRNLWITELAQEMSRGGSWRPVVVSLHRAGPLHADVSALGIDTAALDVTRRSAYPLGVARLKGLIARYQVDVLHSHLFDANLIAAAARKLGVAECLVITRHEPPHFMDLAPISRLKRTAATGVVRMTYAAADTIVAPSAATENELVQLGVPAARIRRIPIGLDLSKIDDVSEAEVRAVRQEFGLHGSLNAVTVSRLAFEKDIDVVLQAWRPVVDRYADARLVIVGRGPLEQELRERVKALGLEDSVRFAGWRADVYAILRASDLMVHPSRTESTGMVLLEALAAGTPLVTTPVGVVGELLRDDVHCRVVPHRDAAAITDAVLQIAASQTLRARLSREGRRLVESTFSMSTMARAYTAIYEDLVPTTGGRRVNA